MTRPRTAGDVAPAAAVGAEVARPTKLTKEVKERIILAIRAGSYVTVAVASAGVSEATFHRWMRDGRPLYRAFQAEVRQALAEAEVRTVGMIVQAARESPTAAMKYLERRHPDRWGLARAGLTHTPPEIDMDPAEHDPRKAPEMIVLRPEWVYAINKLIAVAAFGGTPQEFFERSNRLASLTESPDPPEPWWRYPESAPTEPRTTLLIDIEAPERRTSM